MFQFLRRFFSWDTARNRRYKPTGRKRRRLGVEALEQRVLLAGDVQTDDLADPSGFNQVPADSQQFLAFSNNVGSRVAGSTSANTQLRFDSGVTSFLVLVEEDRRHGGSILLNADSEVRIVSLTEFGAELGEIEDLQLVIGDDTPIVPPQQWKVVAVKKPTSNPDSIDPSVEPPLRLPLTSNVDIQQKDSPMADVVSSGYIDVSTVLSGDVANLGLEDHPFARNERGHSTSGQTAAKYPTVFRSVFLVVAKASDAPAPDKPTFYLTGKRGRSQAFELAATPVLVAPASIPLELAQSDSPNSEQDFNLALSDDQNVVLAIVPVSNDLMGGSLDSITPAERVSQDSKFVTHSELERENERSTSGTFDISLPLPQCAVVAGLVLAPSAVATIARCGVTSRQKSGQESTNSGQEST